MPILGELNTSKADVVKEYLDGMKEFFSPTQQAYIFRVQLNKYDSIEFFILSKSIKVIPIWKRLSYPYLYITLIVIIMIELLQLKNRNVPLPDIEPGIYGLNNSLKIY